MPTAATSFPMRRCRWPENLGMNPRKLGKLDNHKQERWKLPLPQYIEELYLRRFGKAAPEEVVSIEERARWLAEKKANRKADRATRKPTGGPTTEGQRGQESV